MITENDIKQVFFQCHHKDPNGCYADEVDILEFGKKIAAFVEAQLQKKDPGEPGPKGSAVECVEADHRP